ncbi:CGNR zinc finger domain-containing protein [Euzebya sp.]|uniref:CGNR zinc finger domain-containing protein n=1 Tax=Euzebya sp. TaxID=1971409 RepID=UPI003513F62F
MDFGYYGDVGFELANLEPYDEPGDDALRAFVGRHFPGWLDDLVDADLVALRAVHVELREALADDDDASAVERLNALLAAHPVSPQISGHAAAADGEPHWHLHLTREGVAVAERVTSVALVGLVATLLDAGLDRRGVCAHDRCADLYLDLSPGRTRRYCSETCANRANVAAWRARKRAEEGRG